MKRSELKLNKKQQKYYRYVIDRLMENTFVDIRDQKIWHPYDSHYSRHLIGWATPRFSYFVKDKFGILPNEVELIWSHYKQRIKDENGWVQIEATDPSNRPLRESLDYSEKEINKQKKQQQLFDYVLKEMLDGTEIRPPIPGRLLLIVPEFIKPASPFLYPHYLKSPAFPIFHQRMVKYFKDNYGLVANEVITLWNRYREIMYRELRINFPVSFRDDEPVEEIFKKGINESKNKNKREKQQKVLDYALEDLTNNTLLDWGSDTYEPYQIIQFPFSIYPKEESIPRRLEWIMIDRHYNLDITQFYKQFKPYARMMYGLTDVELLKVFADWEDEVIEKIRDHFETDPPQA